MNIQFIWKNTGCLLSLFLQRKQTGLQQREKTSSFFLEYYNYFQRFSTLVPKSTKMWGKN